MAMDTVVGYKPMERALGHWGGRGGEMGFDGLYQGWDWAVMVVVWLYGAAPKPIRSFSPEKGHSSVPALTSKVSMTSLCYRSRSSVSWWPFLQGSCSGQMRSKWLSWRRRTTWERQW